MLAYYATRSTSYMFLNLFYCGKHTYTEKGLKVQFNQII